MIIKNDSLLIMPFNAQTAIENRQQKQVKSEGVRRNATEAESGRREKEKREMKNEKKEEKNTIAESPT